MQTEPDRKSWQRLQVQIADDLPIYLVAGALFAACLSLFWAYGIGETWVETLYTNAHLYLAAALGMVIFDICWMLSRDRPEAPADLLLATYRRRVTTPETLARVPLLAIAVAFMPCFSTLKSMIPRFSPYRWDPEFIAWDRTLFFGHDAVDALQPLVGHPFVTSVLAFLYHAWILLIYVGVLVFLFYRATAPVARQYFLSFLLIWTLVGIVLAMAFPSVGPCFVGPLFGDTTFDAHMAYLQAANEQFSVPTLYAQELLLHWHRNGALELGSGIMAMPSMHVAMAHLTWHAARRVSPGAAPWFLAFNAAIWVGSVHLGYHYAVDGLVSIIATSAIWCASGALLRVWDRRNDGSLRSGIALAT